MIQQIATYVVLSLALVYLVYRIYKGIKKKQACSKCVLMDAVKKVNKL